MLYMLFFSVLAVVLIPVTIVVLSNAQSDLYWSNARTVTMPVSEVAGALSDGIRSIIVDNDLHPIGGLSDYDDFSFVYDDDGIAVAVTMSVNGMSDDAEWLHNFYMVLMLLSIPFWIILCLFMASYLFYRNKLKQPLTLLQEASTQIAQSNLDFHLEYDRRDEMGKLVESFEKMRSALHLNHAEMWRAMEERKRLNAAFSHDLRTPLTVLRGYTDLLTERLPDGLLPQERVQETLGAMDSQLTRLDRYVESMQSMQRLEDVSINITPVDGEAFAEELRATAAIVCDASGKALELEAMLPGRPIMVDPAILIQVYENLLSNAVRFAESKLRVLVQAAAGAVSITVTDDGHGFSPEARVRAKDPYYSSGNTDNAHFGLGLNICEVLCGKHGGRLLLGNQPEGGARVEAIFSEMPELIEK